MMSGANQYDKIAKMNEMAKSLKQHGFADDSLEAIKQAQDIYREDEDMPESVAQSPQQKDASVTRESYEQLSTYLKSNEDFKRQTEGQLKGINETLTSVVGKFNEIIKTINEMEAKLNSMDKVQAAQQREARLAAAKQEEERQVSSVPQPREEKHTAEAVEPTGNAGTRKDGEYANQRIGNYQPTDVSIEKMFYMGKK